MTLPRASATSFSTFLLPRPQPHYVFQRFWLWLVSFPFILALGPSFAFILALGPSFAFHFGLLSLHFLLFYPFGPSLPFILACFSSFALGLDTFWGHRQGVPLFGHMFLPRCFREASARLPQNTEAKPRSVFFIYRCPSEIYKVKSSFRNLPRSEPFREASATFRGLNPVHFSNNNFHRKHTDSTEGKHRNSGVLGTTCLLLNRMSSICSRNPSGNDSSPELLS